jgi:DNA-binding MarR family transcriptional regulator
MRSRGERIYALLREVRPVVLASVRVVEARVRDVGWTVGSRAVAEVLATTGAATVPQVAARLGLARQNVQRQVDDLARLGHVRARPNPAHRRSVLVELTPVGRREWERVHADELAEMADLAPEATDEELEAAARLLHALAAGIRDRHAGEDAR